MPNEIVAQPVPAIRDAIAKLDAAIAKLDAAIERCSARLDDLEDKEDRP